MSERKHVWSDIGEIIECLERVYLPEDITYSVLSDPEVRKVPVAIDSDGRMSIAGMDRHRPRTEQS